MSNLENKCGAIFKDPFFNGKKCNSIAKWKVKLDGDKDFVHFRCGRHTENLEKITLNNKKLKNNIENKQIFKNKKKHFYEEDKIIFKLEGLLEYIENVKSKNDIPNEIKSLFNEIDNLNNMIEKI